MPTCTHTGGEPHPIRAERGRALVVKLVTSITPLLSDVFVQNEVSVDRGGLIGEYSGFGSVELGESTRLGRSYQRYFGLFRWWRSITPALGCVSSESLESCFVGNFGQAGRGLELLILRGSCLIW